MFIRLKHVASVKSQKRPHIGFVTSLQFLTMGWRERTVSSNIIFILAFFRIIPSFKYKWFDRICLALYFLGTCFLGYLALKLDGVSVIITADRPTAEKFAHIANSVNYPLQMIPIIPLIACFLNLNKHLVSEQKLPLPYRFMTFLAYGAVQVISSLVLLYEYSSQDVYSKCLNLLVLILLRLWFMVLKLISAFLIGSSVASCCRKLQDEFPQESLNLQRSLNGLIKDFVGLKKGLQPFLFMTFVTQTAILASFLFLVFAYNYWVLLLFALCLVLDMVYISFVLDDCYGSFKSLVLRLRQCGADKEEGIDVIIYIIEAEQPFTAYGFFNVDRSLLSSIFGNILTYLIILLQYK